MFVKKWTLTNNTSIFYLQDTLQCIIHISIIVSKDFHKYSSIFDCMYIKLKYCVTQKNISNFYQEIAKKFHLCEEVNAYKQYITL